jgi:hypothetical protein
MSCGHGGHHHGGRHGGPHHGGWHRGHQHGCSCGCGGSCECGGSSHFRRRFWTKEEKIAWLEQYLADLREEAKAVEERIAAMNGE